MTTSTCEHCGARFTPPAGVQERYPGWQPRLCPDCYRRASGRDPAAARRGGRRAGRPTENDVTLDEVLATYEAGPDSGVFTDGSANPNPGPGGWGAVYVVEGEIVDRAYGHEPATTNNRMELTAVIHGCDLVPHGTTATVYTDSRLVHDTIANWAAGWERRGWKRTRGEVQNLELVQAAYRRFTERSELSIAWVPAHAGYRWNEYADALSTAYLRERL
ncbi:MAG TPA: ribonuclease H [Nitriliruptorales bacterium]|nr:ribonuclease H [Nitriliruptorales bacterium]